MGRVAKMTREQQQAQQALDLAEMERDRYCEMRRKVLEEAARELEKMAVDRRAHLDRAGYWWLIEAAERIRALATRVPPEPPPWRDSLGPEDRHESNKGPANG